MCVGFVLPWWNSRAGTVWGCALDSRPACEDTHSDIIDDPMDMTPHINTLFCFGGARKTGNLFSLSRRGDSFSKSAQLRVVT